MGAVRTGPVWGSVPLGQSKGPVAKTELYMTKQASVIYYQEALPGKPQRRTPSGDPILTRVYVSTSEL